VGAGVVVDGVIVKGLVLILDFHNSIFLSIIRALPFLL
jgi:hypothetical protein